MEEEKKLAKKLMDKGNAVAIFHYGLYYSRGEHGLPQNWAKANELWLKAGECEHPKGYYNLGHSYRNGDGVEVDIKKAVYYCELAAIGGHIGARYILGAMEQEQGNIQRALMHWIIGARAGHEHCLDAVKQMFKFGGITKDGYANTLRAFHDRQKEMKSDMRDKAAALGMSLLARAWRG